MSYSIPASEDLVAGPNQMLAQQDGASLPTSLTQQQSPLGEQLKLSSASPESRISAPGRLSHQLQQGERRDVVSVSQCCNMMETEDVSRRPHLAER